MRPENQRWWMLLLLAVAECLGMGLWMTASSVTGSLSELWQLTAFQSGWLTTVVQIGFVIGTASLAFTNVVDLFDNRKLFAVCALLAAISNACLVVCPGFKSALICRFLTGLFLAGVYPPAMKMIATWFQDYRGLAIGTIVGALTVGKASPYLLKQWGGRRVADGGVGFEFGSGRRRRFGVSLFSLRSQPVCAASFRLVKSG